MNKISVLGEILAIHQRAEDAKKALLNFMSGSEMFTLDDLTQADKELKSADKKIKDIKEALRVFKNLADTRYVQTIHDNKNNPVEISEPVLN